MRWAFLALLTGCATWSGPARVTGALAVGAIAGDCAVTHHYLATDPTWREANPLLGARPSPVKLWALCALAAGGTLVVADMLPRLRTPFLAGITTIEIVFILHNLEVVTLPIGRP